MYIFAALLPDTATAIPQLLLSVTRGEAVAKDTTDGLWIVNESLIFLGRDNAL